jgi:HEAT repeat protein
MHMRTTVCLSLLSVFILGLSAASADEVERWLREAASPQLQVRLQALRALGESGDVRAVKPLLTALHDDNATIRDCAAAALRSLVRALQGAYETVVQWIEGLLATLGGSTNTAPPPPAVEKTGRLRYI